MGPTGTRNGDPWGVTLREQPTLLGHGPAAQRTDRRWHGHQQGKEYEFPRAATSHVPPLSDRPSTTGHVADLVIVTPIPLIWESDPTVGGDDHVVTIADEPATEGHRSRSPSMR